MKVDYTLPALMPDTFPDATTPQETGLSFRDQLRRPAAPVTVSAEHQLRLDVRPFTASYIGGPPRPASLQMSDPETERSRWHNIVRRHSQTLDAAGSQASSSGAESVRTMLQMLQEMQQMEDSIISRQVAVTRG